MTILLQLQRIANRCVPDARAITILAMSSLTLGLWANFAAAQTPAHPSEERTENGWIDLPAPADVAPQVVPAKPLPADTAASISLKTSDQLTVPLARPPAVPVVETAAPQIAVAAPAAQAPPPPTAVAVTVPAAVDASPTNEESDPSLKLGTGDGVSVTVYGRPELSTTTYVSDRGTIEVPLAGAIPVAGATPAEASQRVASALKEGKFLINPQVTILITQFRSQQVSVLGEVRTPSRLPVESKTTIFDLLAQAGGVTENGASVVFLLRPDANGHVTHYPIDLAALADGEKSMSTMTLRGGDTVFVPKAKQFYIYGEVQAPNMYRLEPNMTVVQAITRSGGLTVRGSNKRVEIVRRNADGQTVTLSPELNDLVQANDVIRVKERIF